MNLDDLKRLAELMQEETGDFLGEQDRFRTALSPERVRAMIRVIEASKALRKHLPNGSFERTPEVDDCDKFDAALAELEAL